MPDAPAGASRAGEPPLSPPVDEAAGHAERPSVPGESARPAGRTDPPVPDSPAQPASSPPSNPSNPSGQPTLSRRVPRANLAAGLRRDGEEGPEPAPPVRDPLAARDALSRFQASQRQAREAVGQDLPDDAGFRPGWGDLDGGPTR
jgi:hypothetical protein